MFQGVILVEGVYDLPQGEEESVPAHQAGHDTPQLPGHHRRLQKKKGALQAKILEIIRRNPQNASSAREIDLLK